MSGAALSYHPIPLFQAPEIHTDLLWDLGILFGGLGLLYFLLIFRLRNQSSAHQRQVAERKRSLAPMISHFLFFDQETDEDLREEYIRMKIEIRQLLKSPLNREVLTEVLMDLRMDVSGETLLRLFRLYQDLGLQQDAFRKLRSWRWEQVSLGILQLSEMRVQDSYGFIRKFINHRRSVIRKQAQLATVSLREEGISYFLDTARYGISEWQQLKLLEILRLREDYRPPRFRAWLTSENTDVVLFALRLIRHYRQNDAEEAIMRLLRHRTRAVKLVAIDCIREFGFTSARSQLKALFPRAAEEVKLQVLHALSQIGTTEDIAFLKDHAATDGNSLVRSKARAVMNMLKPGSALPNEHLEPESAPGVAPEQPQVSAAGSALSGPATGGSIAPGDNTYEFPEPWERMEEEEALFDLCFREELESILDDMKNSKKAKPLPLDFLPIVSEPGQGSPNQVDPVQMENPGNPGELDLDFLPHVVSEETAMTELPAFELSGTAVDAGEAYPDNLQMPEQTEGGALNQFSIFQEFFRHCDTESKLLLLDELPEVGGPKELQFLKTLFSDPDVRLVKKVRIVYDILADKIARESHNSLADDGGEGHTSEQSTVPDFIPEFGQTEDWAKFDKPSGDDRFSRRWNLWTRKKRTVKHE